MHWLVYYVVFVACFCLGVWVGIMVRNGQIAREKLAAKVKVRCYDISKLHLPKEAESALIEAKVQLIGHLEGCTRKDLIKLKRVGKRCVDKIEAQLKAYGLELCK